MMMTSIIAQNLVSCHSCNNTFPDYHALALHISSEKKGHRKGKKWASAYLLKNSLKPKNEHKERTPLSEEDKEARESTHIELSGDVVYVNTNCPKCRRVYPRIIETEYANSKWAWRGENGVLIITCLNCGGKI